MENVGVGDVVDFLFDDSAKEEKKRLSYRNKLAKKMLKVDKKPVEIFGGKPVTKKRIKKLKDYTDGKIESMEE